MPWDPKADNLNLPPLARRNIGSVFEDAMPRAPDKIAIRDPDRQLAYGALHDLALQWAGGIQALAGWLRPDFEVRLAGTDQTRRQDGMP